MCLLWKRNWSQRALIRAGSFTIMSTLSIDYGDHVAPFPVQIGQGATPYPVRYEEVALRIASAGDRLEWKAFVGFTPARLHRPLLGFAGFLQFFFGEFSGRPRIGRTNRQWPISRQLTLPIHNFASENRPAGSGVVRPVSSTRRLYEGEQLPPRGSFPLFLANRRKRQPLRRG